MRNQRVLYLLCLFLSLGLPVHAQFYQPPSVFVMYQTDQEVYVGGIFQSIGGSRASNIAKWTDDPPRFQALGKGVPFVVEHMAMDRRNRLYAAGIFQSDYRRAMARWNGREWENIALPNSIQAILGLLIDPWGYVCVFSTVRDSVERPVLWRSNGGEWARIELPTESAQPVQSIVTVGSVITFAQGAAVWQFDGGHFTMIDGPDPRGGGGNGIGMIGGGISLPYLFRIADTLHAIGSSTIRQWVGPGWKSVSSLPAMQGNFADIEAIATRPGDLIAVRSYHHHEIDIGWDVRRLNRWSGGKWFVSEYPYACTAIAILGNYLLTGHVSGEGHPMISVRKISDVPWIETR